MSEENKHINYTANDIQQYLTGKLSPLQMHALEAAALDDPFLAEALEGYESMPPGSWKLQLAQAKEQLNQKDSDTKVIPLRRPAAKWWRAAAAVFVFAAGGLIFYNLSTSKKDRPANPTIAQVIPPAVIPGQVDSSAGELQPVTFVPAVKENKLAVVAPNKKASGNIRSNLPLNNGAANYAVVTRKELSRPSEDVVISSPASPTKITPLAPPPSPPVTNAAADKDAIANNFLQKKNTATNATQLAGAASYYDMTVDKAKTATSPLLKRELPLNHNFTAQVVSTDNAALPFSNINIKSESFDTYTDVKGNVRLVSSDSLINIEVRSVGYLPRTYTLRSNGTVNKIMLTEDKIAFQEKSEPKGHVMTAATMTSRRAALLKDSMVNVEPADGWDNYNTYVANNVEIPDHIIKNDIHGEVQVSFEVQSNGAITNIKVDKSLCDNCDETAKRILQQGPQWKVKKGKKGKGKLTVQF